MSAPSALPRRPIGPALVRSRTADAARVGPRLAGLSGPALLLGLALLAGCGPTTDGEPVRAPRAIVLFLVDTLRADRLSTYGHERPTSPNLDRLAADGMVFERAWAAAPWTLPSTASLLTGVDVPGHGAGLGGDWRDLGLQVPNGLSPEVPTLAERFAAAGWRCEAFVTNPFVGFGLERGFERFELAQTEGADVVRAGLERLAVADDRPLFLLLHLMDAHDPLLGPDEDVLAVDPAGGPVPTFARSFELAGPTVEYRDARLRVYDGAVHYVDRQLGLLLDGLDDLGLGDRTLVAFTSDHGEELYESAGLQAAAGYRAPEGRGALGHGHTLFEELLHVPLVLGGGLGPLGLTEAAGRRVPGLVAGHDLAPTLLELGGVEYDPGDLDARSLVPTLRGDGAAPRTVFATGIAYGPDRAGLVRDGWQLVRGGDGERTVLVEIGDPARRDRTAARPDLAEELTRDLEDVEAAAAVRAGAALELDPAQRARLRAIGYLGDEQ